MNMLEKIVLQINLKNLQLILIIYHVMHVKKIHSHIMILKVMYVLIMIDINKYQMLLLQI